MLERELSASTINVKLSAIRNLINETKRADVAGAEEAIPDGRHPESPEAGDPPGKLAHPGAGEGDAGCSGPSTLNGKRDCVILALLVGCALRRRELASLYIEEIQMREGRWVIADLRGKGRRIRTIAVPVWVKHGIDAWIPAAKIEGDRLLLPVSKAGKLNGEGLSDWAVWSVVEQAAKQIGSSSSGLTIFVELVPSSVGRPVGLTSRSNFYSGTRPFSHGTVSRVRTGDRRPGTL
jgi:integrase